MTDEIDEIIARIDAAGPTQWREVAIRNALAVMRLRAALKPFAEAGKTLLDEPDDTGVIIKDPITVGDFRRAAKAFTNGPSKEG